MHELVRAFILRPHKLYRSGELLKDMQSEFEKLQSGYSNLLEIIFLRDGGFAICLTSEFPPNEVWDATVYLSDFLDVPPRLVDMAQVA
jgi:hypothetical protein